MINKLISIIIIAKNTQNYKLILENFKSQTHKSFEFFLILDNSLYKIEGSSLFFLGQDMSVNHLLVECFKFLRGDFLSLINDEDLFLDTRYETQLEYLEEKNIDIASCLIEPICENTVFENSSKDSNMFKTSSEIDFAVSSYYIPLDVYTFLIKTSFFKKLIHLIEPNKIKSELDLILLTLSYTAIEKVPTVLYKFKNSRIPYDDNINISNSINSSNKLSSFIENKFISHRNYRLSSLNSYALTNDNTNYEFNILIVLENPCIGGTETHILTLVNLLKKIDIKVFILTRHGVFIDVFINNGVNIIKDEEFFITYRNKDLSSSFKILKNIINSYSIKIIHIHTPFELKLIYDFKQELDIPLILTLHGTYYEKSLLDECLKKINFIISVSENILAFYCAQLKNFTAKSIIENSIIPPKAKHSNTRNFLKIDKSDTLILYSSRLSLNKSKIATNFLNNFQILIKKNPHYSVLILGSGTHFNEVEKLAIDINLKYGKKIHMLGFVYDTENYYKSCDLVIGTGRVALEGLSYNKITLAYGLGGYGGIVNCSNFKNMITSNFFEQTPSIPSNENLISNLITLKNSPALCAETLRDIQLVYSKYLDSSLSLDKLKSIFYSCNTTEI